MSSFPSDLQFIYDWRPYQQRVLQELEEHMGDSHLHLVAAPGAGKTILGLEVARRINRKTLVLVPSLTIRNQWLSRFQDLFRTENCGVGELCSTELDGDAQLTVTTYQSLHAAKKHRDQGIADLTDFETLVLDEAHHLRNEWWKVLIELKDQLESLKLVSLTATPPYDVPAREWNRYFEMCGPIDSIISVPELVKEGNLCPHQDFVYFSLPSELEQRDIREFRQQLEDLKTWLMASDGFSRALLGHPWVSNFEAVENQEEILAQPEIFASQVIFLNALGFECKSQKELLGVAESTVPSPDDEWYEVLLTDMVAKNGEKYDQTAAFKKELRHRLTSMHAVARGKVSLTSPESLDKCLRHSESKLQSTLEIFELERSLMGDELRMVVLTDFIRKEYLEQPIHEATGLRLGAVPIFQRVREEHGSSIPLALLTGSLVVMPADKVSVFIDELKARDTAETSPRFVPLLSDPSYVRLSVSDSTRQLTVGAVTEMFNRGHIHLIVGTTALLGEGWDAPSTNTLVIASASSTYVQTNQVRGRAIRTNPGVPDKVSSIWHLACIEPDSTRGGWDFEKLKSRFSAFEGVSYAGDSIQSGFERLHHVPRLWSAESVHSLNQTSTELAADRLATATAWSKALAPTARARRNGIVEEIRVPNESIQRLDFFSHPKDRTLTLGNLTGATILAGAALTPGLPLVAGYAGAALGLAILSKDLGPRYWKDWAQVLRVGVGPVALGRLAEVILGTLCELQLIKTDRSDIKLEFMPTRDGDGACHILGCSLFESDLFVRSMEEVLDPVENPRYLIWRPHPNRKMAQLGEGDFHNAPGVVSTRKQADVLLRHWKSRLGSAELLYTRHKEGRKALLKARARAWVNHHNKLSERQSVWK